MKRFVRLASFSDTALRQKRRGKRKDWNAVAAKSAVASAWIAFFSTFISLSLLYVGIRTLKYAADQIRDIREQAQTEHLIKKTDEFDAPEFRATRKALAAKRLNRSQDGLITDVTRSRSLGDAGEVRVRRSKTVACSGSASR